MYDLIWIYEETRNVYQLLEIGKGTWEKTFVQILYQGSIKWPGHTLLITVLHTGKTHRAFRAWVFVESRDFPLAQRIVGYTKAYIDCILAV